MNRYIAFLILLFTVSQCGILGNDPKEPKLEPGPRNYTWEVDTLYSPPGGFVYDIWGSSPNDVWAVLGTGIETLWHYDGEKWETWTKRISPALYSIFGFAQDDIWMGGIDGEMYHYNGTQWSLQYTYNPEGFNSADITDIWGTSSDNVYAVGIVLPEGADTWVSFILHFDGRGWQEILITDFEVQFQRIRIEKGVKFMQSIKPYYEGAPPDTLLYYKYDDDRLVDFFTTTSNDVQGLTLNNIGTEIYYLVGTSLSKLEDSLLIEIKEFSESEIGYQIYGRHQKDIFLRMNNGLAHYNGNDVKYLFSLGSSLESISSNAIIFQKEVFFIVRDFNNGTNLIYHGILTGEEGE